MNNNKSHAAPALLFLVVAGILGLHLATLGFAPVNMEFAFAAASEYFATGNQQDLDMYFSYQANTLCMPFVSYLVHSLLPVVDILKSPRFTAILGILPLVYAMVLLSRKFRLTTSTTLLLVVIVLTNPIVWVYSQRGTADFLPMALGMLGLALFITRPYASALFVSLVLLNVAVTLKYHAVVFVIMACLYLLLDTDKITHKHYTNALSVFAASLLMPALYILYASQQFGFWLTPPRFASLHRLSIETSLTNLLSYATWLFLLCLPFSLMIVYQGFRQTTRRQRIIVGVLALVIIIVSLLIPGAKGEMNFGPLDRFISPVAFKLITGFGTVVFGLIIYFMVKTFHPHAERKSEKKFVITSSIGVLLFLLLLSLSRPAQRYLLLALPVIYIMIFIYFRKPPKILLALTLAGFILLDGYATAYQYINGAAAQEMAQAIASRNLLKQTIPGAIESHVGNLFFGNNRKTAKYIVVDGKHKKAIVIVEKNIPGLVRRAYSLVSR